jgi:hypothetical protein
MEAMKERELERIIILYDKIDEFLGEEIESDFASDFVQAFDPQDGDFYAKIDCINLDNDNREIRIKVQYIEILYSLADPIIPLYPIN